MNEKKNAQAGFTLIEIITSIAVLVLVLIAFLPIFPQTMTWTQTAERELISGNLLGRVAQDVKANPAALSLDTFQPGEERTLSSDAGEMNDFPAYTQPVTLTTRFDDEAEMYLVYIQLFTDENKQTAASYIYIE